MTPGCDVVIEDSEGRLRYGQFLGLLKEDGRGDETAVVRLHGYGLYLAAFHPSRVTPAKPPDGEAPR